MVFGKGLQGTKITEVPFLPSDKSGIQKSCCVAGTLTADQRKFPFTAVFPVLLYMSLSLKLGRSDHKVILPLTARS